jgi:acyl carrier protein
MISDAVIGEIAEHLNISVNDISIDSSFEDIGLNGIDLMEIIGKLEDRFIWLYIPESVWLEWDNVSQIINFIHNEYIS